MSDDVAISIIGGLFAVLVSLVGAWGITSASGKKTDASILDMHHEINDLRDDLDTEKKRSREKLAERDKRITILERLVSELRHELEEVHRIKDSIISKLRNELKRRDNGDLL